MSFRSLFRFLHSTSTSNLIVSFRSGIGCSSASSPSTNIVQGFGGRKMRLLAQLSITLATNGITAISRPLSYASRMRWRKSRSRWRIGLFRLSVSTPSQLPRFLSSDRTEEELRILSSANNTLMFSMVVMITLLASCDIRRSIRSTSWR